MLPIRIIDVLVACCVTVTAARGRPPLDAETLIDKLPQISQIGYGYSAMFSGSQFLPDSDSSQVHSLVLGSQAPTRSSALAMIVKRGVLAVPSLLKHLDDDRQTKIPPLSGMMWISFADEYDFNRRVRKNSPTGVNREGLDTFGQNHPPSHTITVGDLCFVALGQIVNRDFDAARYQASGGLMVNSPTYSKRLCAVVRADFEGLTEEKHRQLLVQDFLMPDYEDRRTGACRRLAFYYPKTLEPLVLKQLSVPTYDVFKIEAFVRGKLYRERSPARRRIMFEKFCRGNRQALSDGILLQLFGDLNLQEADEQKRLSPPLKKRYDARAVLVQMYGLSKGINSANRPYIGTWAATEEARFVEALQHYQSGRVDKAVDGILLRVNDDDYLALACIKRLIGRGYDNDIRRYCERRIRSGKDYEDQLQAVLKKLNSRKRRNTP